MSDATGPEPTGPAAAPGEKGPLRRTFDLCVFAPVGVAVSVIEDLPGFVAKGRHRVELHLGNARVVGRFVVGRGQRTLTRRLDDLLGGEAVHNGNEGHGGTGTPPDHAPPADRPAPDPGAEAVVGRALSDYDTLSASQVVRRLESLGPEELRAVQRYEASTRSRRTILNRAGQLLAEGPGGQEPHPAPEATDVRAPDFGAGETPGSG